MAALAAAWVAAAACVQDGGLDYRSPDPAREPSARVVVEGPALAPHLGTMTHAKLHVYQMASCEAAHELEPLQRYLGILDVSGLERAIFVPAGRPLTLRASFREMDPAGRVVSCDVGTGFVPRSGGEYRLTYRVLRGSSCSIEVSDADGRLVPEFEAAACLPDGARDPAAPVEAEPS